MTVSTQLSIESIKAVTGFSASTIEAVLTALPTVIATQMRGGEEVSFKGIGIFRYIDRPDRPGINPKTREETTFKAGRKAKVSLSKNFQALIQPDPAVESKSKPEPEPKLEASTPATPATPNLPPPIPAELIAESKAFESAKETIKWTIKAPDNSLVSVGTDELLGWGVNAGVPIWSEKTGWQLAGKVPELAGLFS